MKNEILPTFIIPGAGKSGTTFVANILSKHKNIFIPNFKEPAYFSKEKGIGNYSKGPSFYQKNFISYGDQKHIGEASTIYFIDKISPRLIAKHIPNIKLIFILRNPVDRLYSNYWQHLKAGIKLPPFDEFIESNHPEYKQMYEYGRYNIHLQRYLEYFNDTQILILLYDQLKEHPFEFFNSITQFLEISNFEKSELAPLLEKKSNQAGIPRSSLLNKIIRNDLITQTIKQLMPAQLLNISKKALTRTREINTKKQAYPLLRIEQRDILNKKYKKDIMQLESLLGNTTNWVNH